ncbi:M15 family metallopeptidase [Streptococcus caviae]|uniref:M15 family metallopeptidase n=1 Tax=Streptococcus sp. 'caviae' TaxID=1915004 RepID=UPI00094B7A81|nr:D-alanyl-D-alanine carboxypeptidase family protein [Streptococcus sp. 'caviae']OLN82568.1 D-alanyl-D-alanine carboxypeptidase [Streptococcus sp. 'caviae']
MRKKTNLLTVLVQIGVVLLFIFGIYLFLNKGQQGTHQEAAKSKTAHTAQKKTSSSQTANLPDASPDDWELVLVNRDHKKAEMNPDLTEINGISVDSRIAENTRGFLAAAQKIDASEHLISGYRSVAYQEELYNNYVTQEKANNSGLSQEEAEKQVQTYSQPPGASEHQTGLAVDMSTVDSLNQSDPDVVAKVAELAPKYGFVLRFPKDKKSATGIDYEDWHYRYVGVKSAKYMTKHNLTLEEYLKKLKEK